jgi:hypothetical protein
LSADGAVDVVSVDVQAEMPAAAPAMAATTAAVLVPCLRIRDFTAGIGCTRLAN